MNNEESYKEALFACAKMWSKRDGIPIVHYSRQDKTKRKGAYMVSIDMRHSKSLSGKLLVLIVCDIMLEIKDKQKSVLRALKLI